MAIQLLQPIPAVGALMVTVIYMIYFQIYGITPDVAGVFVFSALIIFGVDWLVRDRFPRVRDRFRRRRDTMTVGKPDRT